MCFHTNSSFQYTRAILLGLCHGRFSMHQNSFIFVFLSSLTHYDCCPSHWSLVSSSLSTNSLCWALWALILLSFGPRIQSESLQDQLGLSIILPQSCNSLHLALTYTNMILISKWFGWGITVKTKGRIGWQVDFFFNELLRPNPTLYRYRHIHKCLFSLYLISILNLFLWLTLWFTHMNMKISDTFSIYS